MWATFILISLIEFLCWSGFLYRMDIVYNFSNPIKEGPKKPVPRAVVMKNRNKFRRILPSDGLDEDLTWKQSAEPASGAK